MRTSPLIGTVSTTGRAEQEPHTSYRNSSNKRRRDGLAQVFLLWVGHTKAAHKATRPSSSETVTNQSVCALRHRSRGQALRSRQASIARSTTCAPFPHVGVAQLWRRRSEGQVQCRPLRRRGAREPACVDCHCREAAWLIQFSLFFCRNTCSRFFSYLLYFYGRHYGNTVDLQC